LPLSAAESVRVVPDSVMIPAALKIKALESTDGKTVWLGAAFNIVYSFILCSLAILLNLNNTDNTKVCSGILRRSLRLQCFDGYSIACAQVHNTALLNYNANTRPLLWLYFT
jgi:hypothetical protein